MPRVVFALIAEQDLDQIEDHVAEDNPTAAHELIQLFHDKCSLLATQPEMGRARPELAKDLRSFPIGNYLIVYRPMSDGIEVARVLSGARDIESLF
jgi:toxin ParE1/3/4